MRVEHGKRSPSVVRNGLQAWWRHDEGSGVILNDYSGNGNHGDINGSGFWANTSPDGSPVGTYDGSTNYINGLGNIISINGANSITITVAFYISNKTSFNKIQLYFPNQ
jgi:hypothetical protein